MKKDSFPKKVNTVICGDNLPILNTFPDECVDCVITSPPYWGLRDYGVEGQLGLEPRFEDYISKLCDIFDEVKRVLNPTGTCFVVIGDTYGGSNSGGIEDNKATQRGTGATSLGRHRPSVKLQGKSLVQIPSRFAIEMCNRSWILRNEIVWEKPNCMPSSAKDRFTVDFEKVFFFVQQKKYWFEQQLEPVKTESLKRDEYGYKESPMQGRYTVPWEKRSGTKDQKFTNPNGRNKRCVWTVPTMPSDEPHFAMFPEKLIAPMIKAGCPEGGMILDPFSGMGTTGIVARKLNRKFIGIELNGEYARKSDERIYREVGMFA